MRFQALLYLGIGLTIILFTILLQWQDSLFFARYFGQLNVLSVVVGIEPIYQNVIGSAGMPLWANGYIFLHIFLINLAELAIFRRYDFVSMYSFRLLYYLLWHIIWGYSRLRMLF